MLDATHRAILDIVAEAQAAAAPATLRAGRAAAQVGYNRRITYPDGSVSMGDNKEGAVVPWVNVLVETFTFLARPSRARQWVKPARTPFAWVLRDHSSWNSTTQRSPPTRDRCRIGNFFCLLASNISTGRALPHDANHGPISTFA